MWLLSGGCVLLIVTAVEMSNWPDSLTQQVRQQHSPAHQLLGKVCLIPPGHFQRNRCRIKPPHKQAMDVALQHTDKTPRRCQHVRGQFVAQRARHVDTSVGMKRVPLAACAVHSLHPPGILRVAGNPEASTWGHCEVHPGTCIATSNSTALCFARTERPGLCCACQTALTTAGWADLL